MSTLPSIPAQDISHVDESFTILNYMISRGNRVAEYRKGELENLFGFLEALRNSAEQASHVQQCGTTIGSGQPNDNSAPGEDGAPMNPLGPNTGTQESPLGLLMDFPQIKCFRSRVSLIGSPRMNSSGPHRPRTGSGRILMICSTQLIPRTILQ